MWTTVIPEDGTWCWVYCGMAWNGKAIIRLAVRDHLRASGWSNDDCWEDFDGDVQCWIPLQTPDPPIA